jgi:hypothetical protein
VGDVLLQLRLEAFEGRVRGGPSDHDRQPEEVLESIS